MKNKNKYYKHCENCAHGRYSYYHSREDSRDYVCQIKHKYFKHFLRLRAKYCNYFKQRRKGESCYEPTFKPKEK